MRAALYARVSREEQAEGYSLDEQLSAMRRYCEQRGWTVAGEYVDPGFSGTTANRPALRRVLAACEARELDVLLTHQLDRLARNVGIQINILSSLGRWNVGYLSTVEQIDWSTPQGYLFLTMLGAFNEYYVANLRRETRKGKLGRAKAGLSNASHTPYGYLLQEGRHVLDPEQAAVVLFAFEAYATGAYSDTQLATLLNGRGQFPHSGRWAREGVRYLLNNPAYAGQVRHGRDTYPGQQPALVPAEIWQAVRALRDRRSQGRGAGRRPTRIYLLQRLATCSHCGLRLTCGTFGAPGAYAYYGCPSGRRCVECPAAGRWIRASIVEAQLAAIMEHLVLPTDWQARLQEIAAEEQPDELVARRRAVEGKLKRLHSVYIDGDLAESEYKRRRADLRAELARLAEPEPSAVRQAGELIQSIGAEWAQAPAAYQRDILRTLFSDVSVDPVAARIVSVSPHAEFVELFRIANMEVIDGKHYPPAPTAS